MPNESIIQRMKDAAYERIQEQQNEHSYLADLVLGDITKRGVRYIGEIVKLGGDYLVEVFGRNREDATWTTVVSGKPTSQHHYRQEEAVLHLIARRYDDDPNRSPQAAFYAGRVLGLPQSDD